MKQFLKKTSALLLAALLAAPVSAAIPGEYWQYHQPYIDACEAGNHTEIIEIGRKIEEIMLKYPLDIDTGANLGNVYNRSAAAHLALAEYEEASEAHANYVPYAEYLGFKDAVIVSTAAARRLDLGTAVYAETSDLSVVPDYNALYEPDNGIYYGKVAGKPTENESATLFYFEFLDDKIADFDWFLRPIDDEGDRVIEIAMNMPRENDSLKEVMNKKNDKYIIETMKYIATLESPVLLRIGGEMNVWGNLAEPELFKQAFRKLANTARKYCPNAAIVFSPNFVSNFYVNVNDYYPGDEYVDWVGLSLYATRYMNAATLREATEPEKLFYSSGDYANMIAQMAEIVELYGDRKPIMISESGASHSINGKDNVDLTAFATRQLKILYTYINMVYPQVKCILHFDTNLGAANSYDFSLKGNKTVKELWEALTADSVFLTGLKDTAGKAYVKAQDYSGRDEKIKLYTYCVLPGNPETTVTYIYDGAPVYETKTMPYACALRASSIKDGEHTLTVKIVGADGYEKAIDMKLTKAEGVVTIDDAAAPAVTPAQ